MKKTVKDNSKYNVLRWILLLPALCVVWCAVAFGVAYIEGWFYTPELWESWWLTVLIADFFVCPSVALFFATKYIAPKYKMWFAWGSVVLCALWTLFLFSGMSQMAY